ncbi:MAG TPA: hypothetical protein VFR21_30910, partial [Bradyrhizobium sp.]|nr:hypothetical protein [Bradyrhizobium sp.]
MASPARPLSIALVGTRPARRWQANFAEALRRDGHSVATQYETPAAARSRGVELLLELERLAYGAQSLAFAREDIPDEAPQSSSDLTIDLRERPTDDGNIVTLVPLFDGAPGEAALIAAMLEQRAPEITIARWGTEPQIVARGLPALENRS